MHQAPGLPTGSPDKIQKAGLLPWMPHRQADSRSRPQSRSGASAGGDIANKLPQSLLQDEAQDKQTREHQPQQAGVQPSRAQQEPLKSASLQEGPQEPQPELAGSWTSAFSSAGGSGAGAEVPAPGGQGAGRGNAKSAAPAATPQAAGSSRQGSEPSIPQSRCPMPCYKHCITPSSCRCGPRLLQHKVFTVLHALAYVRSGPIRCSLLKLSMWACFSGASSKAPL